MITPNEIRKTVIKTLYNGKASHIGSSMSVIEMLTAIYQSIDIDKILKRNNDRSRVIISKGHCAAAVYGAMAHFGLMDFELLDTYCHDGANLAGHVTHAVDYVEHSTGGLGHGLSVASGCAIGLRSRGFNDSLVFAVMGDGEIQEGSVWEAIMLAAHQKLNNLIVMVDNNRIGGITTTKNVLNLNPLKDRFAGFGVNVLDIDGHDMNALTQSIEFCKKSDTANVIICNTIKGYGIPFAENEPIWHYRPFNDETFQAAMEHMDSLTKN